MPHDTEKRWESLPLLKFLKSGRGVKLAVAIGVLGMVLILLSEWLPSGAKETATVPQKTTEGYRTEIEERLGALLSGMQGVGNCQVYVTLESGVEYVYAKEQKENSDYSENKNEGSEKVSKSDNTQENIIIIDKNGEKTGLLLTEIQPQVKGVVVVCDGGDNAAVTERVVVAVTTALNISSRRVCVTK